MSKKVIIVRHGESMGNIGMKTKSAPSIPLSDRGQEQAKQLVDILPSADAVIYSSYLRTQQTAAPYLEKHAHHTPEEWPQIREFTYLSSKKYDNTDHTQRALPKRLFWEKGDPYHTDGDNAETFAELVDRAEQAIQDIQDHPAENIILFSHEQFIQMLHLIHEVEYEKDIEGLARMMNLFKQKTDSQKIPNATPIDISGWFN